MLRKKYEKLLLNALMSLVEIYHRYNKTGNYLDLTYVNDGEAELFMISNSHDADREKPINVYCRVYSRDYKEGGSGD